MAIKTYAKSVIGASHVRQNTPCEDASWYDDDFLIPNATVLAVADGHGSEVCKYSADGAKAAVSTFYTILKSLTAADKFQDGWGNFDKKIGNNKDFAKIISEKWQKRVAHAHRKKKRSEDPKKQPSIKLAFRKAENRDDWYWNVDYMLYGTTLLGIAVIGTDVLMYQIGDGDIIYVNRQGVRKLIDGDHFLGVETYSLAHEQSWEFAKTSIIKLPELETESGLILLSTDGMSNSYENEMEFLKACKDYFDIIEEDGFESVCEGIGNDHTGWLRDTSDGGCGDDISLALAYFTPSGYEEQVEKVTCQTDKAAFVPLKFENVAGDVAK